MCGIAGVVGTQGRTLVVNMMEAMRHRGPDGLDYCWRDDAHLGAARLSIIDPTSGLQPLYNETGNIAVAFNGEIYNHHELRADLKRKGHVFKTDTDTEVVVHLYEEEGEACVHQLHGMFAFAILDGKRLLLARDRLGIKPLYYTFLPQEQLFLFASEIKGILQCPAYTPRLEMQAFADSVVLGHPVGTWTYFQGVKTLAPGHTMRVSWDEHISVGEQQSYYSRTFLRDETMSQADALTSLEEVLTNAVASHLMADVEVGLTLSGGIDSTLLAVLSRECQSHPALTFTVADDEHHPDMVQAQHVAHTLGLPHRPTVISFQEYLASIPGCARAEEQPCSLSGIPFYFLSQKIGQQVKTCLHGEGADELFGGYVEYIDRQYRLLYIHRRLPVLKQLGIFPSEPAFKQVKHWTASTPYGEYLQNTLEVNQADQLERYHLDPVDKAAMAASVEMRVPYLDDHVFELVKQFPLGYLVRKDLGIRKYLLRHLCLRRSGTDFVDIVLRGKLGGPSAGSRSLDRFDVLCQELLPEDYLSQHELGYCFEKPRQLLMFELFQEIFMVHRGKSNAVGSIEDFMKSRQARKPLLL